MTPAIPADYGKLNILAEKLGVTWEMSPDSSLDLEQASIVLKVKPSEARPYERTSDPLDVANTVDLLTFLFDVGLLTDVGQPAILQRLENLEKAFQERSSGSADAVSATTTLEERIAALDQRAQRIGNSVYSTSNTTLCYRRHRHPTNPHDKASSRIFTRKDALDPKRCHNDDRWYFDHDEIAELERTILHDTAIYAQYFTIKD